MTYLYVKNPTKDSWSKRHAVGLFSNKESANFYFLIDSLNRMSSIRIEFVTSSFFGLFRRYYAFDVPYKAGFAIAFMKKRQFKNAGYYVPELSGKVFLRI